MTPPTSFKASTKTEIHRLLGTSTTATVYLLGDVSAISASTENAIKAMGYKTKRLAGIDRYATSIAIAKAIDPAPELLLLATGRNFPDALGAGAAAGSYNALSSTRSVVVLTNDNGMPGATENYLENWDATVPVDSRALYAIGDQANTALKSAGWSDYGVEAGVNRYATAKKVALTFFAGEQTAGVATGLNWPDALAGGALLGSINGPLLLSTGGSTLTGYTTSVLITSSGSINTALLFGDSQPFAINAQIGTAISGPGGYDSSSVIVNVQSPKSAAVGAMTSIAQLKSQLKLQGAGERGQQ